MIQGNGRRFTPPPLLGASADVLAHVPRARVVEGPAAYEVTAEVPGLGPSDVELTWLEDGLRLRVVRPQEPLAPGERLLLDERAAAPSERTLRFAAPIDAGAVEARLEHGLLRVRLPKVPAARPRRIEVRRG